MWSNRSRIVNLFGVCCLVILGSCLRQHQASTLEDGAAHVRFVGDVTGMSLSIDTGDPVPLIDSGGKTAGNGTMWEILPGRHLLELHRDGQVVLRRDLFVGPGQVLDVKVPK